jgi:hypothetical protein
MVIANFLWRLFMRIRTFSILSVTIAACIALSACSGGGSSGTSNTVPATAQNGTLTISLIDAPRWDVTEIRLQMTGINVKPSGNGPALEFDFDPALDVDLLALTPDNAETLLDGVSIPAGDYNWIELEVNAAFDNVVDDSFVVENDGGHGGASRT